MAEDRVQAGEVLIDEEEFGQIYREWRDRILAALADRPFAILGIMRRGYYLGLRLREDLAGRGGPEVPVGRLDITLYRDDYHLKRKQPKVLGTEIEFPVEDRRILLVDDVLYTGRTVRAAITQLADFGRAEKVELAAFVDRGHRQLPIAADYVGRVIRTEPEDRVFVLCRELDGVDRVEIVRG